MKRPLRFFIAILALSVSFSWASAQNGSIAGLVIDLSNNEPLIGATVQIPALGIGASTDIDGYYEISDLPPGTYQVSCSYISYADNTQSATVAAGAKASLDFSMSYATETLVEIVVEARVARQSSSSLVTLTKKTPSFVTGLSQEDMRRTPDSRTSDALKRVSGTSIQEGRFVVVRGLSDRYNNTLLNGFFVPSTEPDRRAFAFNLIPSNLLDNLLIYKTLTPDLPGEFAGGIILMNTKEVAESDFLDISISSSLNTQSTFQPYLTYQGGSRDWLGVDDGTRALPDNIPSDPDVFRQNSSDPAQRFTQSQAFDNTWAVQDGGSMAPSLGIQLSGAKSLRFKDGSTLGVIGGANYSNTPKITVAEERYAYVTDFERLFFYEDQQYANNTSLSGLANFAYVINPRHRILFNNLYTLYSTKSFTERNGESFEFDRQEFGSSMFFNSSSMYVGQLVGEHKIGKIKAQWGLGYNTVDRSTPDMRNMFYTRQNGEENTFAFLPFGAPSVSYGGRFYSDQNDNGISASADITVPYHVEALGGKSNLKFGAMYNTNDRQLDARWFGYTVATTPSFNFDLLLEEQGTIFDPNNMSNEGFVMREGTSLSDSYTASNVLTAAYGMVDHNFTEELRVTFGVRIEEFNQKLTSATFGGTPINLDTVYLDVLPSFMVSYSITEQHRLRGSLGVTVSRPNQRELAPFTFYNFDEAQGYVGNPELVRTTITNLDARYEYYPTPGQMIAVSAFAKAFRNPIEQVADAGVSSRLVEYDNASGAYSYGIELEFRAKPLPAWTVLGNLAAIRSRIDLEGTRSPLENRELQGQSPYVVNVGTAYNFFSTGTEVSLFFNQIGRRIWQVGTVGYRDVYEAPRGVLDFTVAQRLMDGKMEIRLTASDILNQRNIFYQDQDESGAYEADNDTVIQTLRFGSNYGISFNYKLF